LFVQVEQEVAPAAEYWPPVQDAQAAVPPAAANVPAEHGEHAPFKKLPYPAAQVTQLVRSDE
jgi:hypothetical protein